MSAIDEPRFISVPQLARGWGFAADREATLRREIKAGRIPSMRVASAIRVPLAYVYEREREAGL